MPKTRQEWQRVPLLTPAAGKPIRPLSVLQRQLPAHTVVPAHSHHWGQLVYCRRGVQEVSTPAGRYLIPPDRAVWVPPDQPHEISTLSGADIASIYVMPEAAEGLPTTGRVLEVSVLLRALILEAQTLPVDYDWHGPAGRLFRTLRDQMVVAPEAPLYLPLPEDSRLCSITWQLQQQPEQDLTLAQWGDKVGASERTLQRLFQKETRMTFQQWRQQLRLQVALQRLLASRDSITRIASDLGYESTSTFIGLFQRHIGQTPGEYRKSLQE